MKRPRTTPRFVLLPLAAALLAAAAPAAATDRTWFGGNGDWALATNWTPNGVPADADRAILNAGTATLSADDLVGALALGGSAVGGTATLTVAGASTWTAGTLAGAGTTSFQGALTMSGPATKLIYGGRVVELLGTTTWSGNTAANNNVIQFWNGGTLNNRGTFDDANGFAAFIEHNVGGPHNFNNLGTYNKLGASVTTVDIGVAFNSSGTVNVQAGTLRPSGGTNSGLFTIAAGAVLDYRNGNNLLDNVTTSGAGTFMISSDNVGSDAVVTLNGGTHTTAFVLSGSVLTGSSHTLQGLATWSGGSITGAATTTFANDLTITGPATKVISGGRIVELLGTTTWSGNTAANNNAIQFWNGGTVNNRGTFVDANAFASFIEHNTGGPHNFNNIGTYNKTMATVTTVDLGTAFNNSGTVNVQAGTLRPSGGTSTGVFNLAAGATLDFRDGNNVLNNATTSGLGTFMISTDNVGGDAVVSVNGGTHTTPFVLSGSTLAGSSHTFQGPATWSGGAITGAATTTFAGNVTITGPATKVLSGGRVLELPGTTVWSGNTGANNNAIQFWNGGTLNNRGTFVDANAFASFLEHNTGGPHNFNNIGTYDKTMATLTTVDLGLNFNNTGTLNVKAGTFSIANPHVNQGLVNVSAGAVFLGTNATFGNAGTLRGDGTVATYAGGDVVNSGGIEPGFGIGLLTVDGDLRQQSTSVLHVELASLASFDRLAVTDDVVLGGQILVHNAGYVPRVGDSFVVMTFDQRLDSTPIAGVATLGYGAGVNFEAVIHPHDVTLVVVSVPEPGGAALTLAGLGVLAAWCRRRAAPSVRR